MSHRLNILGALDLRDSSGNAINAVLQQPRRLAVLIYLALAERDKMVKRDTLLGLFWPETTQENGRRSLSQAIHFLRKSLGSDAILNRGNDDVGLNFDVVDCDAARFLAAARAGDLETAAANYGGDLLPGFFASASPEFDQWLDNTREQLRRMAADVFWSAAEEARARGRMVSAAASARRAAELATDCESATRRLIEFLDSIDDRAGALDVYENLVRRLQSEYETMPSTKTRDLAERIRRDGAAVEAERLAAAPSQSRLRTLPWREIKQRSRTLAGAAIFMLAFVSLWGLTRGEADTVRLDGSLAIDAPEVFDATLLDEASEILSDASAALIAVPNLKVIEGKSAAAHMGARFALKPKLTQRDGQLRVSASLVDLETNTLVRNATFPLKGEGSEALKAVALDMSEFARQEIGRHLRKLNVERVSGQNAQAISQARLARIKADSLKRQGLTDYAVLTLDRADRALESALAKSNDSRLHVHRAELAFDKAWAYLLPPLNDMAKVNQEIDAGIAAADRAIGGSSDNADAHEMRGLLLSFRWTASTPQFGGAPAIRAEAEKSLRRATSLNQQARRAWSALAMILLAKGEYAEAYWAAEQGLAADTYFEVGDALTVSLFAAALEIGNEDAASRWCKDISRRDPKGWGAAHCQLQLIAARHTPSRDDLAEGERVLVEAENSQKTVLAMPILRASLAAAYAKAGQAERAHQLLAGSQEGPMAGEARVFRAWALNELGQRDKAHALLVDYVKENPSVRSGVMRSARFADMGR